jgi:hypothetical protein
MSLAVFAKLLLVTSILAGILGSLMGTGGGVVIGPVLALIFKVDILCTIGASHISVIATSSGTAVIYVRESLSNIRIGMFFEVATILGAILGAYLTASQDLPRRCTFGSSDHHRDGPGDTHRNTGSALSFVCHRIPSPKERFYFAVSSIALEIHVYSLAKKLL